MASEARRRLLLDLRKLQEEQPANLLASPIDEDIFNWQAVVLGPNDTEWEGGRDASKKSNGLQAYSRFL
ncbi:hypothetical protein BgAZ_109030 [Babesia gibsoni]|uniref:UBC core domain-containing protein n=1 Tax=Babesia gibsoni TaxID=33632 RepID=A0AAD8PGZ5_BABGI|nr:hypothetical protein BgAZ_109030 [Babesia gibsoni]